MKRAFLSTALAIAMLSLTAGSAWSATSATKFAPRPGNQITVQMPD